MQFLKIASTIVLIATALSSTVSANAPSLHDRTCISDELCLHLEQIGLALCAKDMTSLDALIQQVKQTKNRLTCNQWACLRAGLIYYLAQEGLLMPEEVLVHANVDPRAKGYALFAFNAPATKKVDGKPQYLRKEIVYINMDAYTDMDAVRAEILKQMSEKMNKASQSLALYRLQAYENEMLPAREIKDMPDLKQSLQEEMVGVFSADDLKRLQKILITHLGIFRHPFLSEELPAQEVA